MARRFLDLLELSGPFGIQGIPRSLTTCEQLWRLSKLLTVKVSSHSLFADRYSPPSPPTLTDNPPPSYQLISFGQFGRSSIDILCRCDGVWDKVSHNATAAWVADICYSEYQVQESQVMKASSTLQVEA